jgi:hypothetical protein
MQPAKAEKSDGKRQPKHLVKLTNRRTFLNKMELFTKIIFIKTLDFEGKVVYSVRV